MGGTVWPYPTGTFTTGTTELSLSPSSFSITCDGTCPDPLSDAIKRYHNLIFIAEPATDPLIAASRAARRPVYGRRPEPATADEPVSPTATASLTSLTITVEKPVPLGLGVDESFTLSVPAAGGAAVLKAGSQWGALRGLERFSQLVDWNAPASGTGTGGSYSIPDAPVSMTDKPRFQWRGVLLDTSRHYLPIDALLRSIDAMSYNSFNTLHLHVVDDNSWPLESATYPNFTKNGAYTPMMVYTVEDMTNIVAYAAGRGIRVIPEFDQPAHASIWGKAYPDLAISCHQAQTLLNPTGPVYDVFDKLLDEYKAVFTQDFVHIGGDEVHSLECWNQSTAVRAFAKANGLADMDAVRSYYEGAIQSIVEQHGKRSIVWEEVFDGNYNVSTDTVVNVWLSAGETAKVVKSGRGAIHSYGWYLDQQTPPGGTHYFFEDTWQNFYLNEPQDPSLSPAEAALILGGEASMWGEQVDGTDIDARIWPRAIGTAERLWSSKDLRDVSSATPRLYEQRCRMVQRGIGAGPIRPADETGVCHVPTA